MPVASGILALAEQQLINSFSRSCQTLKRSCRKSGPSHWQPDEWRHSALRDASPGLHPCLPDQSPEQAMTSSPICCLEKRADCSEAISKLHWKRNESPWVLTWRPRLLTACFVFLLFAFLALPLSMAFTGMKFLEDCPLQPLIPLYLLTGGLVGALKASLPLYDSTRRRRLLAKAVLINDQHPWRRDAHNYYAHLLLSLFLFLWFILGNYWVFAVYPPDFLPPFQQPQDYCDKTLCLFAVAVLLLSHTVLGLLVLGSGCVYMWSRWRSAAAED